MKPCLITVLIISISAASVATLANPQGWKLKSGQDPNSEYHLRYPASDFNDDVLKGQMEQIKLTPADKMQAQSWGLSQLEEKRYLAIMGNRGAKNFKAHSFKSKLGTIIVSNNYTPVEVLGINARDNAEREQLAQGAVDQEFRRLGKELSFNAAFSRQAQILKEQLSLPVVRPFDTKVFSPYSYQPIQLKPHDQLLLFVRTNNEVRAITSALIEALLKDHTVQLHVYFEGKPTDKVINHWANVQSIPLSLTNSSNSQVTLDVDSGKYALLSASQHPLPALILVRSGKSAFVDLGRF